MSRNVNKLIPLALEKVRFEETQEGLELYDELSDRRIRLNATTRYILSRMDGERSLGQIGEDMARHYGISAQQAASDAAAVFEMFRKLKLTARRRSFCGFYTRLQQCFLWKRG